MEAECGGPARDHVLVLLLDTNVLLDYFIRRNERNAAVVELFGLADACEGVVLCVASLTLKDMYYLLERFLKREAAAQGRASDAAAAAARTAAWACVRQVLDHVQVVSVGLDEVLEACALRRIHGDFEDDLILAAAMKAGADYLVTSDGRLERHVPEASVDVARALELARSRAGAAG